MSLDVRSSSLNGTVTWRQLDQLVLMLLTRCESRATHILPTRPNSKPDRLQSMVDNLGNMERVANTPIPRSYSIHLKQTVTLYLFSLPFTLIKELGWGMIPVVTVVAFTLMGIEGIADEIEMPFGKSRRLCGYDES